MNYSWSDLLWNQILAVFPDADFNKANWHSARSVTARTPVGSLNVMQFGQSDGAQRFHVTMFGYVLERASVAEAIEEIARLVSLDIEDMQRTLDYLQGKRP